MRVPGLAVRVRDRFFAPVVLRNVLFGTAFASDRRRWVFAIRRPRLARQTKRERKI